MPFTYVTTVVHCGTVCKFCLNLWSTQWHSSPWSLSFFHGTAFTRLLSLFGDIIGTELLFILGTSTFPSELVCIQSAWRPALASDGSSATARSVSVSLQASRLCSTSLVSTPPAAGWPARSTDAEDTSVGNAGSGLFSWMGLNVSKG